MDDIFKIIHNQLEGLSPAWRAQVTHNILVALKANNVSLLQWRPIEEHDRSEFTCLLADNQIALIGYASQALPFGWKFLPEAKYPHYKDFSPTHFIPLSALPSPPKGED